jgi:hypothetical protein
MSGVWMGAAALGGSAISGISSLIGGGQQASAARHAADVQQQMFNTQRGDLAGYRQMGGAASAQLNYLLGLGTPGGTGMKTNQFGIKTSDPNGLNVADSSPYGGFGSLLTPFSADMMKQFSPAYQFQMQQGQQGILGQDNTKTGALSGSALKDLVGFNQNYANTAFNNAFTQYNEQQQNVFNRLSGVVNTGESASSNQATGGSTYAGNIGQSLTDVGTALGAGTVGFGNALSSGMNTAAAMPWLNAFMKKQA